MSNQKKSKKINAQTKPVEELKEDVNSLGSEDDKLPNSRTELNSGVTTAASEDLAVQADPLEAKADGGFERVYKNNQILDHDCYKLEVEMMRKDVSYNNVPVWEQFAHSHIYHTINSQGKKLNKCAAVGGHTHEITLVDKGPNKAPELLCGPACKEVKYAKNGVVQKRLDPMPGDSHTHKVTYLRSDKIVPGQVHKGTAQVMAEMESRLRGNIPWPEQPNRINRKHGMADV